VKRLATGAVLVALAGLAGCGGSSQSPPVRAAQNFITAVTNDDSRSYCPYIGFVAGKPLSPQAIGLCDRSDYFLITGSCDIEATVSGASISSSTVSGNTATVHLSSGGQLRVQRAPTWLVVDIVPAPQPPKLTHGPCTGA
jgi:hypothetical protein